MEKAAVSASVRAVVEFSLLSGDLSPGAPIAAMREGTLAHQARQRAAQESRAEVTVRGQVEGETAVLTIGGRIDLLYERNGLPVIEEIKLASGQPPEAVVPVHRAQAVCYGHLLGQGEAIIRVVYARVDGTEAATFEETLTEIQLGEEFSAFVAPYLRMAEERILWRKTRDASIESLAFPYNGFRAGQREMAVQAYWAVKSKRRLFAQAPTGTGKTAATLFPALKALGEGMTGQIFYLTARTTAQQNAAAAIKRMREAGLRLRALTLVAKEKCCPFAKRETEERAAFRCDVLTCPRAIGFYDRLPDALAAMRQADDWSGEAVLQAAQTYAVCPFEFALSLCEEADAVLCDYNYAFDPAVRIKRIFQWTTNVTLLVDEAHNLPDRARGMLSAELSSEALRDVRRTVGKLVGRKAQLYAALTGLIRWLEAREEGIDPVHPEALPQLAETCMSAAVEEARNIPLFDLPRTLLAAIMALERFDERYVLLTARKGKHALVTIFCLDSAPHIAEVTQKLRGAIFFSATLTPLSAWRDLIGGIEEDGLLALPSPFPAENLLVLRLPVSTRYRQRERTAREVADAILAMALARPGNYLACFPSYAYLRRVREEIEARGADIALHVQRGGMDEAAREAYLAVFSPREQGALLGMVVLGGVFGEGVDLPGDRLSGVAVVGVGLPQVCAEREALRAYYEAAHSAGFSHAYRIPGMNKVLQAVGRVIRTETDRGVALLIDDRFFAPEYAALMPPWWGAAEAVRNAADIRAKMEAFWRCGCSM